MGAGKSTFINALLGCDVLPARNEATTAKITSVYDRDNMPDDFKEMDIRTSFLQKMPLAKKKYTSYLPQL